VCCTQLHGMMTLVVDLHAMIIKNDILVHSYCVELYAVGLVTGTTIGAYDEPDERGRRRRSARCSIIDCAQ